MSDHHPSCRESDKDLVWLCSQCGEIESAADIENALDEFKRFHHNPIVADLSKQLAAEREASEWIREQLEAFKSIYDETARQLGEERDEHGRITANLAMQVQEVTDQLTTVRELRELDRKKLTQVQDAESQQAHEIKRLKDMISQYAIAAHEH